MYENSSVLPCLGSSGTLYNSQLNILVISDIIRINYFNKESQCLPGTSYNGQLNILVISDIKINYFNEEFEGLPKMSQNI